MIAWPGALGALPDGGAARVMHLATKHPLTRAVGHHCSAGSFAGRAVPAATANLLGLAGGDASGGVSCVEEVHVSAGACVRGDGWRVRHATAIHRRMTRSVKHMDPGAGRGDAYGSCRMIQRDDRAGGDAGSDLAMAGSESSRGQRGEQERGGRKRGRERNGRSVDKSNGLGGKQAQLHNFTHSLFGEHAQPGLNAPHEEVAAAVAIAIAASCVGHGGALTCSCEPAKARPDNSNSRSTAAVAVAADNTAMIDVVVQNLCPRP